MGMPLYEYVCDLCKKEWEELRPMDTAPEACACGNKEYRKKFPKVAPANLWPLGRTVPGGFIEKER